MNEFAYARNVTQVAHSAHELPDTLVTKVPWREREVEGAKA
jgi:hypothetical protein